MGCLLRTILKPDLFLIFINDITNTISFQCDIYEDNKIIYFWLSKSDKIRKVIIAGDIKTDLQCVVNW